jgi:hypothetical protein
MFCNVFIQRRYVTRTGTATQCRDVSYSFRMNIIVSALEEFRVHFFEENIAFILSKAPRPEYLLI